MPSDGDCTGYFAPEMVEKRDQGAFDALLMQTLNDL